MNWYKIFYWVTVADNIKHFFDIVSNIFTVAVILGFIGYLICFIAHAIMVANKESEDDIRGWGIGKKSFAGIFYTALALCLITWVGYVACPAKKDALIIIVGGTVGNFITSDSSTKAIPAEAMMLLRDKIKAEIKEVNLQNLVEDKIDTLSGKSKEELLKILKEQKQ